MALSVDWENKVVYSDASILDLPAHHLALRDLEASEAGMLHDDICEWQNLRLGSGAYLPQIDYINGYELEFVGDGPFDIEGNLNATVRNSGVQVNIKTSAAYVTTAVGGSGPTADQIAAAVRAELAIELARVLELAKINGLVPGVPSVVTQTSRIAGDVSQTISEADGAVTVSRA